MDSAMEIFQFPLTGQEIRTLRRGDDVLICHADVCRGLQHSNPSIAIRLVDEDDRVMVDVAETDNAALKRTSANTNMWFLTESGFYALALSSQVPRAREFRRWITHDVLPTLRRTGSYSQKQLTRVEIVQQLLEAEIRLEEQRRAIEAMRPKEIYVLNYVNGTDDCTLIEVLAKELGVKETAFRDWLIARKLVYRREHVYRSGGRRKVRYEWLPVANERTRPWFSVKDQPEAPRGHNGQMATTLYVTPIGKAGIVDLINRYPIDMQ